MIREFGMTKLRNAYIISSRFSRAHDAASKFKQSHVDDVEYYAMKVFEPEESSELLQSSQPSETPYYASVDHVNK